MDDSEQIKNFRSILTVQRIGLIAGVAIIFLSVSGSELLPISDIKLLVIAVSLLLLAVVYFGSIISHELSEVNDQLAGRSPELHKKLHEHATSTESN